MFDMMRNKGVRFGSCSDSCIGFSSLNHKVVYATSLSLSGFFCALFSPVGGVGVGSFGSLGLPCDQSTNLHQLRLFRLVAEKREETQGGSIMSQLQQNKSNQTLLHNLKADTSGINSDLSDLKNGIAFMSLSIGSMLSQGEPSDAVICGMSTHFRDMETRIECIQNDVDCLNGFGGQA